jgi:hypothetical protein
MATWRKIMIFAHRTLNPEFPLSFSARTVSYTRLPLYARSRRVFEVGFVLPSRSVAPRAPSSRSNPHKHRGWIRPDGPLERVPA